MMTDNTSNPLMEFFLNKRGRSIMKWTHYFDIYHRYLNRFRGQPLDFLEIGVQDGGSAEMWRHYFGAAAKLYGVDIDERCRQLVPSDVELWIGDQGSAEFWQGFQQVHPALDVVLDDGGHRGEQQILSFNTLFPLLREGGVYICEDTHTSYMPAFDGGLRREGTFIEFAKSLMDEVHKWYYASDDEIAASYLANHVYSVAVYDSIVVIEKRRKQPPLALVRGDHTISTAGVTQADYTALRGF